MMRLIITILLALAIIPKAWCAQATIMVRPEVQVDAGEVDLGEMSTVQCPNESLSERLRHVQVCTSPLPGKSREITREQIVTALRRAGVKDGSADLLCPNKVIVVRQAAVVTGQALFETAKEFIERTYSPLQAGEGSATVIVEPVRILSEQVVPTGRIELRVKDGTKVTRKGQSSLPVEIVIDGRVYRTVQVRVLVRVLAQVLVASRPISRSSEISPANVSIEERDITLLSDDVIAGANPDEGWMATVPIAEGAVMRRQWVAEPPVVRSGDAVLVIVESAHVRVTDKGTAAQDGRRGERIKVRFPGNIREVRGIVADPGVVKISIPD